MLEKIKKSAGEFKSVKALVTIAMLLAIHTVLSAYVSIRISDSLKITISYVATVVMAVCYGPVVGFVFGALGDIIQYFLNPTGPLALGLTLNAALAAMVYGFAFYKKLPKSRIEELHRGEEVTETPKGNTVLTIVFALISAAGLLFGFIRLLLAYTDRKNMSYPSSFYFISIGSIMIGVGFTLILMDRSKEDWLYIVRIVIAVAIINIGINAFLGTYWLSQLYAWDYGVYFVPRLIKNLIQIPINTVIIYYLMKAIANNKGLRKLVLE